jgi:hypothetical protein
MVVDTGAFETLTAQLAELTEQVRQLAAREVTAEHYFEVGRAAGETSAREAMLGRAAQASRPAAPRARRLSVVSGGAS